MLIYTGHLDQVAVLLPFPWAKALLPLRLPYIY